LDELRGKGLRPHHLAADKAYDDARTRHELQEEGIRAYMPCRHDLGRLERMGFSYDRRREVLTCPAGKRTIGRGPHEKGGFLYYFSERDCLGCPMRSSCLEARATRKRVYVKPEVFEHRPRGLKRAMRVRKTVERLFGAAKVWHRMGRARYRGLGRVAIGVIMTLIVLNAKKMATRPRATPVVCAG
jgi:IS5 family transposase